MARLIKNPVRSLVIFSPTHGWFFGLDAHGLAKWLPLNPLSAAWVQNVHADQKDRMIAAIRQEAPDIECFDVTLDWKRKNQGMAVSHEGHYFVIEQRDRTAIAYKAYQPGMITMRGDPIGQARNLARAKLMAEAAYEQRECERLTGLLGGTSPSAPAEG